MSIGKISKIQKLDEHSFPALSSKYLTKYSDLDTLIEPVSKEEFLYAPAPNTIRAGIIPYSRYDDKVYWCMGLTPKGKWADFGGGCKLKRKEKPFDCLIREVHEESSGILTSIVKSTILDQSSELWIWKAQSRKNPPVFRYLILAPIPYKDYNLNFRPNSEINSLIWIPQNEAIQFDNLKRFHDPIRQYIRYLQFKLYSDL